MGTNDEQDKTYPILKVDCLKDKCSWWVAETKQCVISEIARCIS